MIPEWQYLVILVWQFLWSGIVLWRSARLGQRNWFIVFLVIHTMGILESVYLFYFCKKKLTLHEIKSWFNGIFFTKVKK
jgi:hypothetical protein